MPVLDGFELAAAIRLGEAPGTRLPIIAVTGDAITGVAQRCLDCGMDDYLTKPMQLMALDAVMARWLPRPTDPPTAEPAPLQVWDAALMKKIVGPSATLQQRLLELFLRDAPYQVAALREATAAGQLAQAADTAHVLKTAAHMVGAMRLAQCCEALQDAVLQGDGTACAALAQTLQQHWLSARRAIQSAAKPMA
jgi:CheY-like chemotaxis protein